MHVQTLSASEIITERPFTQPRHTARDLVVLRKMIDQLCLVVENLAQFSGQSRPIIIKRKGGDGYDERVVISRPGQLSIPLRPLTIVGFFGQKRPTIHEPLIPIVESLDTTLLGEFANHPNLYSYSTTQLPSGNYANLVLFGSPTARDNWGDSPAHIKAALEISPQFYQSLRLYNGKLPMGLMVSDLLHLTRIKYYDFRDTPVWRAIREIV